MFTLENIFVSRQGLALILLAVLLSFFVPSSAYAERYEDEFASPQSVNETENFSDHTQDKIQTLFNNLEVIGNAYNGGGGDAAKLAALDQGCQTSIDRFLKTNLVHDIKDNLYPDLSVSNFHGINPEQWISQKTDTLSLRAKNAFCAMIKGEEQQRLDLKQTLDQTVRGEILPALMMSGVDTARMSKLPFLARLEVEIGTEDKDLISSITTIQPLWQDKTETHHVFTQLSYHKAPKQSDDNGFKVKHDTINAGLAYRHLSEDKEKLYGANIFFDHAPKRNHNRVSLGVDARTSQLSASANRYMPLSDWKSFDQYYEDRAAAGWDLELRGQVPELPSWTASVKGYQWDNQDDEKDLYGATASLEYAPVPALAVRVGIDKDTQNSPQLQAALRLTHRFDQPEELQWKQKTELAPVKDYAFDKVHRENIIRTKVRRKHSSKLIVLETSGANIALEETGTSPLSAGKTLLMPVTVTTANTVGAYTRLRFAKGATLTLGQNTQVRILPDLITLITGTIQFVSDGQITNVAVPGGTIVLHGTDIDVSSNGINSAVRVRDGAVTFTGSVAGQETLEIEEMAESIAGVVGAVAIGSPNYITHTDQVSSQIDWIAAPLNGVKVAPYPIQSPYIISQNLTPGQQIVIGVRYNSPITVTGAIPFMNVTINGNPGTATYISGSGTAELRFAYTVQPADNGATDITVSNIDANGASLIGDGKEAVTTIADATLSLSGAVADTTPPTILAVIPPANATYSP